MKFRALTCAALLPLLVSSLPVSPQDSAPPPKSRAVTLLFLRHAEAMPRTREQRDPALAEAGKQRAARVARTLRAAGVTRVFATGYQRTQQTAKPIADAMNLEVETYSPRKAKEFVDSLRALPDGAVAVVVGHSNTVPMMVKAIGGKLAGLTDRGFFHEQEHDRLIVQTMRSADAEAPLQLVRTLDLRIE